LHAALLIARLDNDEVDVGAYRAEVERMARKVAGGLPKGAGEKATLAALNRFLFTERGFHGSRADYYNRANMLHNLLRIARGERDTAGALRYLRVEPRNPRDTRMKQERARGTKSPGGLPSLPCSPSASCRCLHSWVSWVSWFYSSAFLCLRG
jgi:hypothetical protein